MAAAAAAATAAVAGAAHLLKQETNNQTPFSRYSRNGKTPPNFVPKNDAKSIAITGSRGPKRPF